MKKIILVCALGLLSLLSLSELALAQFTGPGGQSGPWAEEYISDGRIDSFAEAVSYVLTNIGQPIIAVIMSLALIYFLWGVLKYVKAGGDTAKRTEGRNVMVYGIIALFVMTAVWGLVNVVRGTFPLDDTPPQAPQFAS